MARFQDRAERLRTDERQGESFARDGVRVPRGVADEDEAVGNWRACGLGERSCAAGSRVGCRVREPRAQGRKALEERLDGDGSGDLAYLPQERDPDPRDARRRHERLDARGQVDLDEAAPWGHAEVLSETEAAQAGGGAVEAGASAQVRVETVSRHAHACRHRPARRPERYGAIGRDEVLDRAAPTQLDPALDGAPGQRRRQSRPPDAEPATVGEPPFGRRAVLLNVADALERRAVASGDVAPRPEGIQHPDASRHEPLAARLVRGIGVSLAHDRRKPCAGREDRGGQPCGTGTRDRDVEASFHG